jgi:hypothetical protein
VKTVGEVMSLPIENDRRIMTLSAYIFGIYTMVLEDDPSIVAKFHTTKGS